MAKKKRSIVEKISDAVDHALHPDKDKPSELIDGGFIDEGIESSSVQSDLAKHPKFAKFKSQGENQP